jgi:uncharacterized membrane protein
MTFLAFALWALLQRRYMAFAVWSLLTMSCKEDMPLLVFMMGLYIFLIQRQWKVGVTTIAVSVIWFVTVNFVVIPAYSPVGDNIHIVRYASLGSNMGEVIANFFTHPLGVLRLAFQPTRLPYWIMLTMPVAFTSLLDPLLLVLSLPSLAINTLSSKPASYCPVAFHYTAPIVPFIIVSSVSGVARLSRWLGRSDEKSQSAWRVRLLIAVTGASLGYHLMVGYTPLRIGFQWPSADAHDALTEQMLRTIPPQASVSAQNNLVPHLINRRHIYTFPKVGAAEYIALDIQSSSYPFGNREELCQEVRRLIAPAPITATVPRVAETSYGLIYFADDSLLLLQRGAPDLVDVPSTTLCSDAP